MGRGDDSVCVCARGGWGSGGGFGNSPSGQRRLKQQDLLRKKLVLIGGVSSRAAETKKQDNRKICRSADKSGVPEAERGGNMSKGTRPGLVLSALFDSGLQCTDTGSGGSLQPWGAVLGIWGLMRRKD